MGVEIFSLEGKAALVTGASRGMGAGVAVGLAQAGADVAVTARSEAALREVAGAVAATGRRALAVPGDVTVVADVERLVAEVIAEFGQIDILVNNAGGPLFNATFLDLRPEGWSRLIDLNLNSVATCCRSVVPIWCSEAPDPSSIWGLQRRSVRGPRSRPTAPRKPPC